MTTQEPLPLCLVGLGMMARNHLFGYEALHASGYSNVEIAAVCDVRPEAAEAGAAIVEQITGRRPRIYNDLSDVLADEEIAALDIVTEIGSHHDIAIAAMDAGKHVICEKPLALTVRSAMEMVAAGERNERVFATAENYRRNRWCRLAKALVESGCVGDPTLFVQHYYGGSNRVSQHPWRHLKDKGGAAVDMTVHFTDLIRYLLGEFDSVTGDAYISEPVRHGIDREGAPFTMTATGEDALLAAFRMKSGARATIDWVSSGRGRSAHYSALWGQQGSISLPPLTLLQRRDDPTSEVTVHLEGRSFVGEEVHQLIPDYRPSPIEEAILDYRSANAEDDVRNKAGILTGIQLHDFARAVLENGRPEVDGRDGTIALAAVLGALESRDAGGVRVTLDEVLDGTYGAYQAEVETVR